MKCAADVTFACDEQADLCGFCAKDCPYLDCPVHGHHPDGVYLEEYVCRHGSQHMNDNDCEAIRQCGSCEIDEDGRIVWQCGDLIEFKEWMNVLRQGSE